MNVHAEGLIPAYDQYLFMGVQKALHGIDWPKGVSCHSVAIAVERTFAGLTAKHGRFCVAWQHSWVVTGLGSMIDVYPVAVIGGPLLLDGHDGPWLELFREIPGTVPPVNPNHVNALSAAIVRFAKGT